MDEPKQTEQFANGLISLLKEYTPKLQARLIEVQNAGVIAKNKGENWVNSGAWQVLHDLFMSTQHPLLDATRAASQLAEQGAVTDIQRIELQIRRAEVEGLLRALEQSFFRFQ